MADVVQMLKLSYLVQPYKMQTSSMGSAAQTAQSSLIG